MPVRCAGLRRTPKRRTIRRQAKLVQQNTKREGYAPWQIISGKSQISLTTKTETRRSTLIDFSRGTLPNLTRELSWITLLPKRTTSKKLQAKVGKSAVEEGSGDARSVGSRMYETTVAFQSLASSHGMRELLIMSPLKMILRRDRRWSEPKSGSSRPSGSG